MIEQPERVLHDNNGTVTGCGVLHHRCLTGGPEDHHRDRDIVLAATRREQARRAAAAPATDLGIHSPVGEDGGSVEAVAGAAKIPAGSYVVCDPAALFARYAPGHWNELIHALPSLAELSYLHGPYGPYWVAGALTVQGPGLWWSVAPARSFASDTGMVGVVSADLFTAWSGGGWTALDRDMQGFEFDVETDSWLRLENEHGTVRISSGDPDAVDGLLLVHHLTLPAEARDTLTAASTQPAYPLCARRLRTYRTICSRILEQAGRP